MNYELKGSGFIFNIYHYLWLKDLLTKVSLNNHENTL